jgi:hypothetical protein
LVANPHGSPARQGWQQLAGLQIGLAQNLEAPAAIRNFVAGAIQFQFAQHNIRPEELSSSYLGDEMRRSIRKIIAALAALRLAL